MLRELKEFITGSTTHEVIPDVAYSRVLIANICCIGYPGIKSGGWALVDAGLPMSGEHIKKEMEKRYGDLCPHCILLTHGHFDHVGAVVELADYWDVEVYAHEAEIPYLTGRSSYPPPDTSISDGILAKVAPLYPRDPVDLGDRIKVLPSDGEVPYTSEWKWVHTPGHTPGHVAFFREKDRFLIAGDAFITTEQESLSSVIRQDEELSGPPAYFTPDWEDALKSIKKLQALKPDYAVTGHGKPIAGDALREELDRLVDAMSQRFTNA